MVYRVFNCSIFGDDDQLALSFRRRCRSASVTRSYRQCRRIYGTFITAERVKPGGLRSNGPPGSCRYQCQLCLIFTNSHRTAPPFQCLPYRRARSLQNGHK